MRLYVAQNISGRGKCGAHTRQTIRQETYVPSRGFRRMAKHNKAPFRIFKRGEIWHTYFSVVANGRRIVVRESTGCSEENAAKEYCSNRVQQIIKSPAVSHEITLDAAATKWYLEYGQNLQKPDTILSRLKIILQEIDKNILLSQITKNDISVFVNTLSFKRRSPATINRYLSLLSAICRRAREFWDCKTPDFKIMAFKQKEPTETIKYFKDMGTVQSIIEHAAPHLKPIIWTAIYTGLRLGKILSLQWSQIDFDNSQIVFIGKNGLNQSIPMVPELINILKSIPRNNIYVFTYNGRPIKEIKNSWRAACTRANIEYQSFHTLRHTLATWLLRDTNNLRLVKDVLGHKSIQTTIKYAHLCTDARAKALSDLFK